MEESHILYLHFALLRGGNTPAIGKNIFCDLLIAVISQIPFSMALYTPNMTANSSTSAFTFRVMPAFLLVSLAAVVSYWYFVLGKKIKGSLFVVAVSAILPAFLLKVNYMWILTSDSLNVLYTLTIGLVLLFIIEKIEAKSVATLIPAVLILMYSQERGINSVSAKWLFYVFYPLHLLLIGLTNMFLKG